VGRSTAYRWWQARFVSLREQGASVSVAARQLRVPLERATAWEAERRDAGARARRNREAAERRVVRDSTRHAEELMRARAPRSDLQLRDTRYWELMRSGLTNTEASRSWACIARLERGSVPATISRLPLRPGLARRWAGI
jgi:hypothetical protein